MSVLNNITKCTCGLTCFAGKPLANSVNLQFVRFRKPRWVPKAKSKIFKVREPTPRDPVEFEKMKEWTNLYNTEFKSVRSYLVKYTRTLKEKQHRDLQRETLSWETRFSTMVKRNDKWNAAVKEIRLKDQQEKQLVEAVRQQKIKERDIREREEMRESARQKVLEVAEMSSEYISEDKLDTEIEKLLNTRVSYEFALKPDGSIVGDEEFEGDADRGGESSRPQTPKPPES